MKILILLTMLLISTFTKSQKLNFLDSTYFTQSKVVIFYTIVSWCSENIDDYNTIKDTLIKYRDYYNLILFIDTVKTKSYDYRQIISNLKPNNTIILNKYFPKRLSNNFENKKFTNYVNGVLNLNLYRLGPSTLIMVNDSVITPLLLIDRTKELSKILNITHK